MLDTAIFWNLDRIAPPALTKTGLRVVHTAVEVWRHPLHTLQVCSETRLAACKVLPEDKPEEIFPLFNKFMRTTKAIRDTFQAAVYYGVPAMRTQILSCRHDRMSAHGFLRINLFIDIHADDWCNQT